MTKRIIMVMPEPPLPFGNAAARWYFVLLRGLVQRQAKVTALAGYGGRIDTRQLQRFFPRDSYDLRLFPHELRRGLKGRMATLKQPYSYMFDAQMRKALLTELESGFDVLHLEQLWSGWLGQGYEERCLLNVHHLQAIDFAGQPIKSLRDVWDRWLIEHTERRLLSRYRHIRSCSPRLTEEIGQANPNAKVKVIPVGMAVELYPYCADVDRPKDQVITLIGQMGWYPSYSAAVRLITRLWPKIKRAAPQAKLRIIGWGARQALADYLHTADLEVLENVPDTMPYFAQTSVFVYAPSRGSGMKIKILEAMALGIPVVTTMEGVEGLPALDGVHCGLCEDDEGLAERTISLLHDPAIQNEMRRNARTLVEQHCSAEATVQAIWSAYEDILKGA